MEWIRRNWPDLLIGLALLAVIAGIIATLLNGGSFFPFGQTSSATPPPAVTSSTSPPSSTSPSTQTGTTPPATSDAVTTEVPGASGESTASQEEVPTVSSAGVDDTPQVASSDADTASTIETEDPVVASQATTVPEVSSAVTETSLSASSDAENAYRILVGSFGNAENAARSAEAFSEQDFPTFTGTQNDLTLVLVGPYDTAAEAEQALSRVRSTGLADDAQLFTPEGVDASGVTPTSSAASPTPTDDSVDTASATVPATSADGRYLQTGAYGSSASAQPQRELLENLGFSVTEVEEGSLVKLLVGPFDSAALPDAQARLNAQGVEHFVRSN